MDAAASLLREARLLGFLGPGPLAPQVAHALAYVSATTLVDPALVVDLGSGGGLPALVLLANGYGRRWVLVERSRTRADWLQRAVHRLAVADRVEVRCESAEAVARSELRGTVDLVTARSFAPLSVTAEVAAPFLREGGELVASLDANQLVPTDVAALQMSFERIHVGSHLFCRGRPLALAPGSLPRSWRAMQRSPLF